jgi:hypothetical protein
VIRCRSLVCMRSFRCELAETTNILWNFRSVCEIHWRLFTDASVIWEDHVDRYWWNFGKSRESQSYLVKCIDWKRWDVRTGRYFLWLSAWFCDRRWLRWPKLLKTLTNLRETTILCDLQAIFNDASSLEWLKFWNVRRTGKIWCCLAICGLTFAICDDEDDRDC